jgi:hypothetical protein
MTDQTLSQELMRNKISDPAILEHSLDEQIGFQKKWQLISMIAYVFTTIGTLVCSAGATFLAAEGEHVKIAAILSAAATIFVGAEKSLLFREKWKFHLLMQTKLKVLKAKVLLGRATLEQTSDEFTNILSSYAAELPMAAREEG